MRIGVYVSAFGMDIFHSREGFLSDRMLSRDDILDGTGTSEAFRIRSIVLS